MQVDLLTLPILLLAVLLLVLVGVLVLTDRRTATTHVGTSDIQRLGAALVVAGVLILSVSEPALLALVHLHRGWVVTGALLALLGTVLQAVEVLSHPGR